MHASQPTHITRLFLGKAKTDAENFLSLHCVEHLEGLFLNKASVFGPRQTVSRLHNNLLKVAKEVSLRRSLRRPSVNFESPEQTLGVIRQRYLDNPSSFFTEVERMLETFSSPETTALLDIVDRVWAGVELLGKRKSEQDAKRPNARLMDALEEYTGDKFESGNPRTIRIPYHFVGMLNEEFLRDIATSLEKTVDKPFWQLTDKLLFSLVIKDLLNVNIPMTEGGFKLTPRLTELDPDHPVLSQLLYESLQSRLEALGYWWNAMFSRATDVFYELKEASDVYDVVIEHALPILVTRP